MLNVGMLSVVAPFRLAVVLTRTVKVVYLFLKYTKRRTLAWLPNTYTHAHTRRYAYIYIVYI